jgi:hypothetical protein
MYSELPLKVDAGGIEVNQPFPVVRTFMIRGLSWAQLLLPLSTPIAPTNSGFVCGPTDERFLSLLVFSAFKGAFGALREMLQPLQPCACSTHY